MEGGGCGGGGNEPFSPQMGGVATCLVSMEKNKKEAGKDAPFLFLLPSAQ